MITLNAITLVISLSVNQDASPRKKPFWALQRSPLYPFLFIFKETYKWFWGSGNKNSMSLNYTLHLNSQLSCSRWKFQQGNNNLHYLRDPEQNENMGPHVQKVFRISRWLPQSLQPNTGFCDCADHTHIKPTLDRTTAVTYRRLNNRFHPQNSWQ